MMKKLFYLSAGVIVLFSTPACQDRKAKNYNKDDDNQNSIVFIKSGIESGMTEIKASGLAITNSNNQKVIGLAKMMIEDHTKAGEQLKQLEADKKIAETDTISSAHQQKIKDLSTLKGNAFDKAYMQMMVADHADAVKLFTTAIGNADAAVKKVASENLPTIKMHLDSATAVNASLK